MKHNFPFHKQQEWRDPEEMLLEHGIPQSNVFLACKEKRNRNSGNGQQSVVFLFLVKTPALLVSGVFKLLSTFQEDLLGFRSIFSKIWVKFSPNQHYLTFRIQPNPRCSSNADKKVNSCSVPFYYLLISYWSFNLNINNLLASLILC